MSTLAEAFRLLNQATFGATEAEAERVIGIGVEAWIEEQIAQPASLQLPRVRSLAARSDVSNLRDARVEAWFSNVTAGPDQLRQRVAFALSQIMVVSDVGDLRNMPLALADYHDLLARNAFGNFRELLVQVTLHPAMGVYLSMLGNRKSNPQRNISPDENYARELLQLFSIGLVELNIDGTVRTDSGGKAVPAYDQDIVEAFARVFTGWNYSGASGFDRARRTENTQIRSMKSYRNHHDTDEKVLLNGERLSAGQSGPKDLDDALDNIFSHPNVGPFVAIRLIQRLVTSNPSPAYVSRVASAFNDNGAGVRGDLEAVVRAILLDSEARVAGTDSSAGKLKEPLLRLTQLWRAYGARSANGTYSPRPAAIDVFAQGPLQAPSVFNFFSPSYAPAGEIAAAGLTAPELQIASEYRNTQVSNYFYRQVFRRNSSRDDVRADTVVIDIGEELALAADVDALIERVSVKLLAGQMSDTLRRQTRAMVQERDRRDAAGQVAEAVFLVVTSPEYARQH